MYEIDCIFFVKPRTTYDMRISDWSSDVCSSDLTTKGSPPAMAIQIRTSLDEPETGQSFVPHRPERPPKAEGGKLFKLVSDYQPSGDQPQADRMRVVLGKSVPLR